MTDTSEVRPRGVAPVSIEEEMKRSYLDYAMSVIVSRALPDVRDGLKPVHRRILFSMEENGYQWNRPYRKSARVVGDVMGKYHPHGDTAIYDAMVRMAQDFSMRLPLIDGQGNFGSMDGDRPAAMRYTEARLARSATALLDDLDKDTVDFQANYDESEHEPTVLPARFPNLLVNGAGGIAVGMATNVPPHNLGEVVAAALALIDDPEMTIEALMEIVPGPDFPTGGLIMGRAGIHAAYHTGRGSVVMRGRVTEENDERTIVITEIPYQVNKSRLVEQVAEAVRDKRIEGISDLRDESDRDGVRVVVELKRNANFEVVLSQLYRYTPLQTSFGVNALALDGGRPQQLTLKRMLEAFLAFREEVITRRTKYELRRARERAHILAGLAVAVANIDDIIAVIRNAADADAARRGLMDRAWPAQDVAPVIALIDEPGHAVDGDGNYRLSAIQTKAILDLRLQRLTGLEREKIAKDLEDVTARIVDYLDVLRSRTRVLDILRGELRDVAEQFGDSPRRTTIQDAEFEHDIEDLIQREDMVVTLTHKGYVKRVPLSTYRAQRRGGKGRSGMATREEDFVSRIFVANTHTPMLFFTSRGMAHSRKVYRLPLGTPQARGRSLVNLLPLAEGETIATMMPLPENEESWGALHVMFSTSQGTVRRNALSDFTNIMANGKIAMKLEDKGELIGVQPCGEDDDVLLAAASGKCIRFSVTDVRVFAGRSSTGVRGIRLKDNDRVISMSILDHAEADSTAFRDAYLRHAMAVRRGDDEVPPHEPAYDELAAGEQFILTVTENGYGKRSSAYEYRIAGRGGQGIINIETSDRNGEVVASFPVGDEDQILLVTDGGQLIRCPVADIRIAGRNTQGVTLFKTAEGERVVSVSRLDESVLDGDEDEDGNPD
ncbi:MAG: DNA gyrase subunit A [Alphaproteobacteria bacterium]|nr:DNA gyrase subunit A [Alphaproteobacteria bacterium]MDP6237306.1 DNA gyrase subunit A [Alphaproteobacteria bacterium]MDP7172762.1 DNA gyrase subunit A [Alphaproteobacteria bacterium]MDP7488810.1 DNA gyrase subunit A [Alphaproteobacteria bacterium]